MRFELPIRSDDHLSVRNVRRRVGAASKLRVDALMMQAMRDLAAAFRARPQRVPHALLLELAGLSAGRAHTGARIADGTVRCWGSNAFGECGGGKVSDAGPDESVAPSSYAKPHTVAGIANATVVGAGGSYRASGVSCVGTSDLKMYCWGIDKSYQLGRGQAPNVGDITPAPARPVPE